MNHDHGRARWWTYAMLFCGMAVFGTATPVSKYVGTGFPPLVAAAGRVLTALLVLGPVLFWQRRQFAALDRRAWLALGGVATLGMFGFTALLIAGMNRVPGVAGSAIMSLVPAVTAMAAATFLGDAFGWRRVLAIALAVGGVLAVNVGGDLSVSGLLSVGAALVFGAVCCEAAYTVLGKRAMMATGPLFVAAAGTALSLPIFLVAAAFEWGQFDAGGVGWRHWLGLAWWGLGTLALGSLLWYGGVNRVAGATASGFMGVMPVSALLGSYLILGEAFAWWHAVGFALVLAAVAVITWADARTG